jgi:hypothetical protein
VDTGDVGFFHQALNLTKAGAVLVGAEGYESSNYNQIVYSGTGFIAGVHVSESGGPIADVFSTTSPAIQTRHDILKKRFVYNGSFGEIEHWAIIFPFFNREGYYLQTMSFLEIDGESYGYAQRIAGKESDDITPIGTPWIKSGSYLYGSTPGPCSEDSFVPRSTYQYTGGTTVALVGGRQLDCGEDPETNGTKTWTILSEVDQSVYNQCQPLSELEEPLRETLTSNMVLHYFNVPNPGDYNTEAVEDSSDSLFISSIVDDVSDCTGGASPLWVGNWIDVFTGNGWVSPNFRSEVQLFNQRVVGNPSQTAKYDFTDLPSDSFLSGWFGLPFREFM